MTSAEAAQKALDVLATIAEDQAELADFRIRAACAILDQRWFNDLSEQPVKTRS